MYSTVAISRSSRPRPGPVLRTSSALNREWNASAIALPIESPFAPTDVTEIGYGAAVRDMALIVVIALLFGAALWRVDRFAAGRVDAEHRG
jgi:hypothetical protein